MWVLISPKVREEWGGGEGGIGGGEGGRGGANI